MQLSIELPDDLGKKVIERFDLKQLSQEFVAFMITKHTKLDASVSQPIMRSSAHSTPITASLTGLLAKGEIHEQAYQQHLEDKYL